MLIQRMIQVLGRLIFYMLLLPLLGGLVYTLSHGQLVAALVFLVLCVIVLYFGLIRMRIPAHSLVVRDGKVVFFIPEKTVRDRFDFASRGQTIVQLPHYGLLDRPYRLEIFSPDGAEGLRSCRLSLTLGYIMDLPGWQRAYDHYVTLQDRMSLAVRTQLFRSATHLEAPVPVPGEENRKELLQPIVDELNRGLENLGLRIKDAACAFTAGPALVRFVAGEQEIVEKAAAAGGAPREGAGPA